MRKHTRFIMIPVSVFFLVSMTLFPAVPAFAKDVGLVDGLWVMKKVDDRYEGDDVQEDMFLTLERTGKRSAGTKNLEVRWLKKDYGREDKLVVHFIAPSFAEGVTLNMIIKPYLDDDRWLYFPSANIIRRVQAKDQHSNFMGTDFTYYDLSEREPDEENHKLLRIEDLNGSTCYVVETTPKEPVGEGYSKKITWVDKDRFTKMRIQYYNKAGKFFKQYDPGKWEKIDGIWTPKQLVMENHLIKHKTTIDRTNIRYNQGISDDYFLPQHVDCVVYKDGKFSLIPFEERPTKVWADKNKGGKKASEKKK